MKPHTVTLADLNLWVAEEWFMFACSVGSDTHKRLERHFDGRYKVRDNGEEIYCGLDMKAAIDAYNAAP